MTPGLHFDSFRLASFKAACSNSLCRSAAFSRSVDIVIMERPRQFRFSSFAFRSICGAPVRGVQTDEVAGTCSQRRYHNRFHDYHRGSSLAPFYLVSISALQHQYPRRTATRRHKSTSRLPSAWPAKDCYACALPNQRSPPETPQPNRLQSSSRRERFGQRQMVKSIPPANPQCLLLRVAIGLWQCLQTERAVILAHRGAAALQERSPSASTASADAPFRHCCPTACRALSPTRLSVRRQIFTSRRCRYFSAHQIVSNAHTGLLFFPLAVTRTKSDANLEHVPKPFLLPNP